MIDEIKKEESIFSFGWFQWRLVVKLLWTGGCVTTTSWKWTFQVLPQAPPQGVTNHHHTNQINTNHQTSSQIEKWKFNVQQTVESEPWLIIDYDQHINWEWKWTQALSQGATNYGDDIDQHRNQIITRIIIIVMRIIYYDLQIFCTCYWWSTTFKFHEMSLFVKFSHGVSCPK